MVEDQAPYPVTTAQVRAQSALKAKFGERGYAIFPITLRYGRNPLNFVAVAKGNSRKLLVVRVHRRQVRVQSVTDPRPHNEEVQWIKSLHVGMRIRYEHARMREVRPVDWWLTYIPPPLHEEFAHVVHTL